jgi:hypothetical protein
MNAFDGSLQSPRDGERISSSVIAGKASHFAISVGELDNSEFHATASHRQYQSASELLLVSSLRFRQVQFCMFFSPSR